MSVPIPVIITYDNPDPEDCPTTFMESIALQRELIHGEITQEIIPYIRQAATPGVDQQSLIWHKLDASGRPLGTYSFYGGAWRRQYAGKIGEIVLYGGDPALHFESNGRGIVGGDWDGFALCNGNNGTLNLSDKFIVAAKMDDLAVGYPTNGPWKTSVSGTSEQTGGAKEITLTEDTTYRKAVAAIQMSRWEADGNTPNAGGGLWGLGTAHTLLPADAGNLTPDTIPTLPPYFALAYAVFQGYA